MDIKTNNRPVLSLLVLAVALVLTSVSAYADTRYVSDTLVITMRTGAGDEYRIIKTLKTDTPVEVLEESGEYLKVRVKDGTEGWVLKQYISPDTPKPTIISRLRNEIDRLKSDIAKLDRERDALRKNLQSEKGQLTSTVKDLQKTLGEKNAEIKDLTGQLNDVTARYNRLLEDSKDVVNIVNERDMLTEENERLASEKDVLQKKNTKLARTQMIYWFLAGGGVFFIGWIAGQFSRRKRMRY